MADRKKVHRVTFDPDRSVLVKMPDGKHRVAKVSLAGSNRNGRILTFEFIEAGANGEVMKVYL